MAEKKVSLVQNEKLHYRKGPCGHQEKIDEKKLKEDGECWSYFPLKDFKKQRENRT